MAEVQQLRAAIPTWNEARLNLRNGTWFESVNSENVETYWRTLHALAALAETEGG